MVKASNDGFEITKATGNLNNCLTLSSVSCQATYVIMYVHVMMMMILLTTVRNTRHLYNTLGEKKASSHVNLFKPKLKNEFWYLLVRYLVSKTSLHLVECLRLVDWKVESELNIKFAKANNTYKKFVLARVRFFITTTKKIPK